MDMSDAYVSRRDHSRPEPTTISTREVINHIMSTGITYNLLSIALNILCFLVSNLSSKTAFYLISLLRTDELTRR